MSRLVQSAKVISSALAVGAPMLFANPASVLTRSMMGLQTKVLRHQPADLPSLTNWVMSNHLLIRGTLFAVASFSLVAVLIVWRSKQPETEKPASLLWIVSGSTSIVLLIITIMLLALFLPQVVLVQSIQ